MATSLDIRRTLVDALKLDLIGPSPGHALEAEVLEQHPSRWYLTGFLVPTGASRVPAVLHRYQPHRAQRIAVTRSLGHMGRLPAGHRGGQTDGRMAARAEKAARRCDRGEGDAVGITDSQCLLKLVIT